MTLNPITDTWFLTFRKDNKKIFSELDVLLKSLDRFFYIENLPVSKDDLTKRNFNSELSAVRDVVFRVLGILEVIIPESKKNAFWFQKFSETKYLTDQSRDIFREKLHMQDTHEKGLFLLYSLFINLKYILTDLLKTGEISYLSYTNIGHLIGKEIHENKFFNPFKRDINPDFDVIENPEISEIVRSLKDRETKKYISVLYLYLFRFLRYLNHVDISSQDIVALHSSLLILIMLRSEINMLHSYIQTAGNSVKDPELQILLKSISYQFSLEIKRVYLQGLKDIMQNKAPQYFRGTVENSYGILKNLTEQTVIQLAQFFKPDIQGKNIFDSFTTKLFYSMKLREDIFVLYRFLKLLEDTAGSPGEASAVFEATKNYMQYFQSFTFKLLRYDDYHEFTSFFNDIYSFKDPSLSKLTKKIHNFKIFLETTLRHIENRSELRDKPIDTFKAEETSKQYL